MEIRAIATRAGEVTADDRARDPRVPLSSGQSDLAFFHDLLLSLMGGASAVPAYLPEVDAGSGSRPGDRPGGTEPPDQRSDAQRLRGPDECADERAVRNEDFLERAAERALPERAPVRDPVRDPASDTARGENREASVPDESEDQGRSRADTSAHYERASGVGNNSSLATRELEANTLQGQNTGHSTNQSAGQSRGQSTGQDATLQRAPVSRTGGQNTPPAISAGNGAQPTDSASELSGRETVSTGTKVQQNVDAPRVPGAKAAEGQPLAREILQRLTGASYREAPLVQKDQAAPLVTLESASFLRGTASEVTFKPGASALSRASGVEALLSAKPLAIGTNAGTNNSAGQMFSPPGFSGGFSPGTQGSSSHGVSDGKSGAERARRGAHSGELEKLVQKIKEMLDGVAQLRGGRSFTVRLDPPQLGSVMMKVVEKAGEIFARLIPECPDAEFRLRERLPELLQVLQASGINPRDVHVSIGAEHAAEDVFRLSSFHNQTNHGGMNSEMSSWSGRSSGTERHSLQESGRGTAPELAAVSAAVPGWVA